MPIVGAEEIRQHVILPRDVPDFLQGDGLPPFGDWYDLQRFNRAWPSVAAVAPLLRYSHGGELLEAMLDMAEFSGSLFRDGPGQRLAEWALGSFGLAMYLLFGKRPHGILDFNVVRPTHALWIEGYEGDSRKVDVTASALTTTPWLRLDEGGKFAVNPFSPFGTFGGKGTLPLPPAFTILDRNKLVLRSWGDQWGQFAYFYHTHKVEHPSITGTRELAEELMPLLVAFILYVKSQSRQDLVDVLSVIDQDLGLPQEYDINPDIIQGLYLNKRLRYWSAWYSLMLFLGNSYIQESAVPVPTYDLEKAFSGFGAEDSLARLLYVTLPPAGLLEAGFLSEGGYKRLTQNPEGYARPLQASVLLADIVVPLKAGFGSQEPRFFATKDEKIAYSWRYLISYMLEELGVVPWHEQSTALLRDSAFNAIARQVAQVLGLRFFPEVRFQQHDLAIAR